MSILQGTTPSLVITVPDTVDLSAVTAIELTLTHDNNKHIIDLSGVTVDTTANTITYDFTEAFTLSLDPEKPMKWQLRVKTSAGKILGTPIKTVSVLDLMSEEAMG